MSVILKYQVPRRIPRKGEPLPPYVTQIGQDAERGIVLQFGLSMPEGAKILTLQLQMSTDEGGDWARSTATIWALCDENPTLRKVTRLFTVHGTGIPFSTRERHTCHYVGTWQEPPMVWHLFDRGEI